MYGKPVSQGVHQQEHEQTLMADLKCDAVKGLTRQGLPSTHGTTCSCWSSSSGNKHMPHRPSCHIGRPELAAASRSPAHRPCLVIAAAASCGTSMLRWRTMGATRSTALLTPTSPATHSPAVRDCLVSERQLPDAPKAQHWSFHGMHT